MAELRALKTFGDARGSLTVIERECPFPIKRVYFIHGCGTAKRGGHRHIKTIQGLVAVAGACSVRIDDGVEETLVQLDQPEKFLVLAPSDWHEMSDFTPDCVLLVLASEPFDGNDYVHEGYNRD